MAICRICSVEGCGKPHKARGYCVAHYERFKAHGDPLGGGITPGTLQKLARSIASDLTKTDCISWPSSLNRLGYGNVWTGNRKMSAHRYICILAHGEPPTAKHEAAHTCGNGHKACVNPAHLRWATKLENQADRKRHGTDPRGERHPGVKLTEKQVHEIRSLEGKLSGPEIGRRYGVTYANVWAIHRRKSWWWLPDQTSAASENSVSTATSETRTPRTPRS